MANDMFAPTIGGGQVSALASPVATPVTEVVDNSASNLANTIGAGLKAFAGEQAATATAAVDKVNGDFAQKLGALADARARGEISNTQYKMRGTRLYKDFADAAPALAPELAKHFNTVTGLNVGEFAQQKSPQELAADQYQKDVAMLSQQLNVPESSARGIIANQTRRALRKDELALKMAERENTGAEFTQSGAVYAADFTDAITLEVSRVYEAGGELTPTQVGDIRVRTRAYATQLKQNLLRETGGGVDTRSMQEFDDQMEAMIRRVDAIAQDRSQYQFYKNTSEIMGDQADIYLQENYGSALRLREILGDTTFESVLIELRNMPQGKSALLTAVKNDPIMAVSMKELRSNPDMFGDWFVKGFDKLTGGENDTTPMSNQEAAAVGVMLNSARGYDVAKSISDGDNSDGMYKVFASAPSTIVSWTSPKFKTAVANGDLQLSDVENSIEGAMFWAVSDSMYSGRTNIGQTLTISTPMDMLDEDTRQVGNLSGVPEVIFGGKGVTPQARQALMDAYRVIKEYPQLWEGKYDSPAQYMQSVFDTKFGVGAGR